MISEVVNALFLTYVASEYLTAEDLPSRQHRNQQHRLPSLSSIQNAQSTIALALIVILINIIDHVTGTWEIVDDVFQRFLHLPRILFAGSAYILGLYLDIRYHCNIHNMTIQAFSAKVGWAFLRVLPAYPFLAVVISFVFLFVINIWEAFGLPDSALNAPIYYGTLYGPFAWVYVYVKRQFCAEATSLPV